MIDEEVRSFEDLVTLLSRAIGQRALYFRTHPRVENLVKDFLSCFQELMARDGRKFVFLGFIDGSLVHEGRILIGPTILGRRLVETLTAVDSGGILLKEGLTEQEVHEVLDVAVELKGRRMELTDLRAALKQGQVTHILFSPPYGNSQWFGQFLFEGGDPLFLGGSPQERLLPVYRNMFGSVEQAHASASLGNEIDVPGVQTVAEQLVVASDEDSFTDLMQLVHYPDYDTFTVGHSVRVASIAMLVASRVGMPRELRMELATAGMLHDVGKGRVPEEILYKPGQLDEEERRVIERHPVLGAQILLDHPDAGPMSLAAAWGHHLRYDGGGYPTLPAWGATGRITALLKVCDVFEALTAARPYKSAMSSRRAYEIMVKDEGGFDPGAFRALVESLGLYPPGTRVMLSSGEQGEVVRAGRRIELPVVRLTHDASGEPIGDDQPVWDLSGDELGARVSEVLGGTPKAQDHEEEEHDATANLCSHPHGDPDQDSILRHIEDLM